MMNPLAISHRNKPKPRILQMGYKNEEDPLDFYTEEEEDSEDYGDDPNEEEEEKEEEEEEEEEVVETKSIIVKVVKGSEKDLTLNEYVCIKIDKDVELRWLMIHYCEKLGLTYDSYKTKFMFNCARVRDTDTPLQLSMVNNDVIYVFNGFINHFNQGFNARTMVCYGTMCIRMHKRRDTFVRVARSEPLLGQLKRHFSNGGKLVSTCFVYDGRKLTEHQTVDELRIEDGEIIDAFNFDENSSSLSMITPISNRLLTVKVKDRDGRVLVLKAKGNTYLSHLALKFAEWRGLSSSTVILSFNRRELALYKTVEEERLVDGCQIDGRLL